MLSLQLLIVFSAALSTHQQGDKDCENLILDFEHNLTDSVRPCTQVYGLKISMKLDMAASFKTLKSLNPLQAIDSSTLTFRHFVSLDIQNTHVLYAQGTFLPNLERIIPAPNSTASAIMIRGNVNLCLPEKVKTKLLNMVDGQGYIQPCACLAKPNDDGTATETIIGGDNCRILRGPIVFIDNSNLSEKMKKQLETVEELYGSVRFVNTTFTNFDFIRNLRKVIYPSGYPQSPAVVVAYNDNLKKLNFLLEDVRDEVEREWRKDSLMVVKENPHLRYAKDERPYYLNFITADMDIRSEERPIVLEALPCQMVQPVIENIPTVHTCSQVVGNLTIDSSFNRYSYREMEDIFGNLKFLEGCLTIRDTQFTNLTFLHDLLWVNCSYQRPALIIEDNPELTDLDVQVHDFHKSVSRLTIKVSNNPKLCVTQMHYLKNLMSHQWRVVEFDRWEEDCGYDVKEHSSDWLLYYYAIGAGILFVGMIVLEGVVRLDRWRRMKKAAREKEEDSK